MKEEYGKLMFQWLLPFAISVFVVLIMFLNFSDNIRKEAESTVENSLEEVAERYAFKVSSEFECIQAAGETAAQVASQMKRSDSAVMQLLLEAIVDNTQVCEAVYCDKNGETVDHLGNKVDLGKTDYTEKVQEGSQESSTISYFIEKEEIVTGSASIVMGIPITDAGDCFLLFYPLERLKTITEMNGEFNDTAFVSVINIDGDIFQVEDQESNFLKGHNIWSNIDQEYQDAASKAKVNMQNYKTDSFVTMASGEERTLLYTPISVDDWVLLIGIDQSYIVQRQDAIYSKSIRRLYQLLSVIFLFVTLVTVVNYVSKIRSAEKNKHLQEKADTDLLTGLNNKLATERKIKEYMEEKPNSLGMLFLIDLDNFKKINDTMGHAFGDEVLRSLGKQIGVNFRVTDIIGRIGGDEFMIFLKDLQKDEIVLKEAKKLDYFFKHFEVGEYVKYSATASIGAAVFPADGSDFESLYKSADKAVYKAKKRGKNQIAFFDDRDIKQ